MVVMYITTKRRDVELDRASIKLELPDFLKLYDPVNAPVLPATVPSSSTPVQRTRRRTANGSNTVQKASHQRLTTCRGRLMGYLDRADYQRASHCSSVGVTLCHNDG